MREQAAFQSPWRHDGKTIHTYAQLLPCTRHTLAQASLFLRLHCYLIEITPGCGGTEMGVFAVCSNRPYTCKQVPYELLTWGPVKPQTL